VRRGGLPWLSQSHAMFPLLNSAVAGAECISYPKQVCCGNRHWHACHFLLIGHIRLLNNYHICQTKSKSICAYNTTPLHKNQSDQSACRQTNQIAGIVWKVCRRWKPGRVVLLHHLPGYKIAYWVKITGYNKKNGPSEHRYLKQLKVLTSLQ